EGELLPAVQVAGCGGVEHGRRVDGCRSRDPHRQLRRPSLVEDPGRGVTVQDGLPRLADGAAERCRGSETGDDDVAYFHAATPALAMKSTASPTVLRFLSASSGIAMP